MKRLWLLLAVLVAGCGGGSDEPDLPDLAEPEAMMLRLSDLPAGFRYGADRGCGELLSTDGHAPRLDEFLTEARPRGCVAEFSREWGGPPRGVESALLIFGSDEDARRAWAVRERLFANFGAIYLTSERGGGDAIAFDSEGEYLRGAGEAWRDGRIVVVVYEEGLWGTEGRQFAAGLAGKQRERIEAPSSPSGEDDREIGLDDPAIDVPVYWLGRRFAPEGFPELELLRGERVGGTGLEVEIEYDGGVTLGLWKPEAWKRAKGSGPHVSYDEVVVSVRADGPYGSRAGLDAVKRGLRRR